MIIETIANTDPEWLNTIFKLSLIDSYTDDVLMALWWLSQTHFDSDTRKKIESEMARRWRWQKHANVNGETPSNLQRSDID